MKLQYNEKGRIERKFSTDWWFNHMRSSQKAMIEYIEQLHNEIDRLTELNKK